MKTEFRKKLLKLAIPIALQQFMLALVSACDALMLGGVNQDSLSAVSLATQVTFVFNLLLMALTIGENMFVAQYFGKRDFHGVRESAGLVMRYVLVISFVFFILTLAVPELLMRAFTNDPVLIIYGSRYLRIVGLSYVFSGVLQVQQGIMKNCGSISQSTGISVMVVLLNILLNGIFIYGWCGAPEMGIGGAALATVLANGVGTIAATAVLIRKEELWLGLTDIMKTSREMKRKFWKHVYTVLLNEIAWGGGFTMYSVIMGHLGSDAVAANSIANITKNLLICICVGFGYGGSMLVGNYLGEGKFEKAKETGNVLWKIAVLSGVITGGVIFLLVPVILHVTSLTDTSSGYLKWMLVISSYYVIGKSISSMTIGGVFPAGGDTAFGLKCDAVTMWCFTVPVGCIMAFVLKMPVLAVYFVLNLDEIVKIPAIVRHYKKYIWVKNLTEKGE